MNNDNYYNLTIFEKTCLFLHELLNVILFIFSLQLIFTSNNIIISLLCLLFCIISLGYYLAKNKIDEKTGHIMKLEENYNKYKNFQNTNKNDEK